MRSQRTLALFIGLALVAAACGGGTADVVDPTGEGSSTIEAGDAAPATSTPSTDPGAVPTTGPTEDTALGIEERPAPDPNREVAPDFDLLLSDGSTFVLSEETRPVFMVFWAEW